MLALGVSVVQHFRDVPPDLMNMKLFWQHAISCGVFAKLLAGHMVGLSEERFFVAGLIHDIGRLVLAKNYPQTATRVLLLAKSRPCTLPEAEQEVLGFDHAEVGRLLLRGWKFPTSLEQVVGYHHKPMRAQHVVETGILHVANVMAHAFLMHGGAPLYVPPLDGQAWEELDLSPSVIAPAMRQAERQVEDIFQAFLSKE
jgi:HD-like signal output (HDOD) protein